MAITGPRVQMPTSLSEMFTTDEKGKIIALKPEWAGFYSAMQQTVVAVSRSGQTSSRPTATFAGRFVGMPYFDTDLGFSINLKTPTAFSSSDVWVNSAGAPV